MLMIMIIIIITITIRPSLLLVAKAAEKRCSHAQVGKKSFSGLSTAVAVKSIHKKIVPHHTPPVPPDSRAIQQACI